jgi:hypothetical protein
VDIEERRRRREEARRRVVRQRRIAAAIAFVVLVGGVWVLGAAVLRGEGKGTPEANEEPPPPEVPRGGRTILPGKRVVAYYGAPQDEELGVLGIGSPDAAARKLERQARPYRRRGREVLPAFELITTVAANSPGDDGDYADRQSAGVIDRYLRAARRRKALLILDIQPGYSPFMKEVRALRRWLEQPDVSLALDPEWSVPRGQVPGRVLGSTDAATINQVSAYLSRIVRRRRLPQKLLLVHRFTHDMIREEKKLARRPGVSLVINVDGFGNQPVKIAKYREFTRSRRRKPNGFKLFYREDTKLMSPRQVLRLRPAPDVVVYE